MECLSSFFFVSFSFIIYQTYPLIRQDELIFTEEITY